MRLRQISYFLLGQESKLGPTASQNPQACVKRPGMKLLPKGMRGRIAVGLDVVQSTLDCNRQWDEFVKSMNWNRNTHRVCHRLNIGLEERPPNLDDISAIATLKEKARTYLKQEQTRYLNDGYKSAHKHVLAVAQRLTAALFYFEPAATYEDGMCVGILHCHLGSAMRNNFRHFLNEAPMFRVLQKVPGYKWRSSELKPQFDELTFSGRIAFTVRSERRVIEMTLPKWSGSWERISGFSGLR